MTDLTENWTAKDAPNRVVVVGMQEIHALRAKGWSTEVTSCAFSTSPRQPIYFSNMPPAENEILVSWLRLTNKDFENPDKTPYRLHVLDSLDDHKLVDMIERLRTDLAAIRSAAEPVPGPALIR